MKFIEVETTDGDKILINLAAVHTVVDRNAYVFINVSEFSRKKYCKAKGYFVKGSYDEIKQLIEEATR